MKSSKPSMPNLWQVSNWGIVLVLIPLAVLSLYRGMVNALGYTGSGQSVDLHPYWYAASQLFEGTDPYQALLSDGTTGPDEAAAESKEGSGENTPASSPLMVLLLTPLGLTSWPAASLIWALANLGLALSLPWVVLRLLPRRPSRSSSATIVLVFYAMLPTRNVISNGQTSLLVVFALLLAVLAVPKKQWAAGLLLGIALSKYSLTFPAAAWFLACGHWTTVVIAFVVQGAGVLLLSLPTQTTLWSLITEYFQIAFRHMAYLGDLDLPSMFARLALPSSVAAAPIVLGLVLTLVVLGRWRRSFGSRQSNASRVNVGAVQRIALLSLLLILPLPLVYHRAYDAIVLIMLPVTLLAIHAGPEEMPQLQEAWHYRRSGLLVIAVLLVFVLPRFVVIPLWPMWDEVYPLLTAAATTMAWGVSLWYLWQIVPAKGTTPTI